MRKHLGKDKHIKFIPVKIETIQKMTANELRKYKKTIKHKETVATNPVPIETTITVTDD